MKKMSKEDKMTAEFILGVIAVLAGLTLLFFGIFMPPMGVIDSSVLVAFGETATFAGALIGVDYNYRYKIFVASEDKHKEGDES